MRPVQICSLPKAQTSKPHVSRNMQDSNDGAQVYVAQFPSKMRYSWLLPGEGIQRHPGEYACSQTQA